ncbi:hypothetical protein [Vibrio vulnificus]|uniref:hypothetical protein n=1 Tax=Vibrio vulnificus TaxID=672 RepID=UPI0010297485|nr:hypothetical protein [Vibrio vulnificus]RZP88971.1 hypothetical protein D8T54_20300 [Vibrio vulnificus]
MSDGVFWLHPIGKLPEGWIERNAYLGNWFVKVCGHEDDYFVASMVNMSTSQRVELYIAPTKDLELACTLTASAAKIMIQEREGSQTIKARVSLPLIRFFD